jgi:hypothetical protein
MDAPTIRARSVSELLNRECFCITLDRDALCEAIEREVEDPEFCAAFIRTRPHLFSSAPVFISESEISEMLRIVRAIEAAARLPGYQEAALSWAPNIARYDFGPRGVFMGYDFHLGPTGPKLIEVNTNAGGAFLNALVANAQRACCREIEVALLKATTPDFAPAVLQMFRNEFSLQRRDRTLKRVAIVDDLPEEQYLYPEFLLAQRLFMKHGIEAVVVDPQELRYEHDALTVKGKSVDLVYNRLVDFSLDRPEHDALRLAYLDDAVVVTPNPHVHALHADKRNLVLLSDQAALRGWGLSEQMLADLAGVPTTTFVTSDNAAQLWERRRTLFFKPVSGHGSKGVYRGDKITKRVWAEVIEGDYVAQEFAPPGERVIKLDGASDVRKTDVRLYVYEGQILLTAARLYQGQTTNFRTPGGGFAPVFAI